jgi:uncharacterized membrane protein (UPF0136 family)
MHNFANTILWIYIVLLLMGGMIGFFKAKSHVSLIMSVGFAVALIITTVLAQPTARELADILMAALLVVFTIRLVKTKKFMPSGLMLVITVVALALRNIPR